MIFLHPEPSDEKKNEQQRSFGHRRAQKRYIEHVKWQKNDCASENALVEGRKHSMCEPVFSKIGSTVVLSKRDTEAVSQGYGFRRIRTFRGDIRVQ
jgi:hypothetical protein